MFRNFGRLKNEYLVDMFSRYIEQRLVYIQKNLLRVAALDAELMRDDELQPSQNVYLPKSFLGSIQWTSEQISEALALAATFGNPTFFITMTCNPKWNEITDCLLPGQDFSDVPDVVVRVFKSKLSTLLSVRTFILWHNVEM